MPSRAEQSLAEEVADEAAIEDANYRESQITPSRVAGFEGIRNKHPVFVIEHAANKIIESDRHLATRPGPEARSALLLRMRAVTLELGKACWQLQDEIDRNYPNPYQSQDGTL